MHKNITKNGKRRIEFAPDKWQQTMEENCRKCEKKLISN